MTLKQETTSFTEEATRFTIVIVVVMAIYTDNWQGMISNIIPIPNPKTNYLYLEKKDLKYHVL